MSKLIKQREREEEEGLPTPQRQRDQQEEEEEGGKTKEEEMKTQTFNQVQVWVIFPPPFDLQVKPSSSTCRVNIWNYTRSTSVICARSKT